MAHPEVPETTSEDNRHMNRSSIGIMIGVIIAVILFVGDGVGTLLFGCVLGAIGGAYLGAAFDVRGAACDILKSLHSKLDPYRKNRDEEDKTDAE
jgi:uncharacterized protein YcfJ